MERKIKTKSKLIRADIIRGTVSILLLCGNLLYPQMVELTRDDVYAEGRLWLRDGMIYSYAIVINWTAPIQRWMNNTL